MKTLTATNLAKSYRGRRVIEDVSVKVGAGEVVGLLGPNGAGKTTCFYMIVGLLPPDSGRIRIDDRDITRLPMHGRARAGIGYLPQEASIFRRLSVADNIMAILETRRDLTRKEREQRLEQLLQEFHITHIRNSLGMALNDIKDIIRHLKQRGIGVLITDHNVRETLDICDTAYIVSAGHIIAEGNADTILANQQVRDVYLGADFRL